jgi:hypothetical protein
LSVRRSSKTGVRCAGVIAAVFIDYWILIKGSYYADIAVWPRHVGAGCQPYTDNVSALLKTQ